MNLQHLRLQQAASLFARPHRHGALTRRQFLKAGLVAAAGAGLAQTNAVWAAAPRKASAEPRKASGDPRPIPYGTPFLFPDPTIFHVEAPGYPLPNPPFDTNPATNNPATITDFNGVVGLTYVGGHGTHHNLVTGQTSSLYWEVDMRFMVGEYVGHNGHKHHATLGFI